MYACAVGITVANMALPWLLGSAVDKVSVAFEGGSAAEGSTLILATLILVMGFVGGALATLEGILEESVSQRVVHGLRNRFYDHVQNLSFGFHDRHATGDLVSRGIRDVNSVRHFISLGLVGIPFYSLTYLAIAAILLWLDWRLGLIAISLTPLLLAVSEFARRNLTPVWLNVGRKSGELSTALQQALTGIRVVKAFDAGEFEKRKFNVKSREVADLTVRGARLYVSYFSFLNFAFLVLLGMVMWYGGSRVISTHMSYGDLSRFLLYVLLMMEPVRFAERIIHHYAQGVSSGQRLFEIMDTESPVQESDIAIEMPRAGGHVTFENVRFRYDDGGLVLKGIDIDVEPGKVVALLGSPGSGKSSLVNLLPRFYDVSSGRITIDGIDIRNVTLESLRRNVGIVQQNAFLFSTSIGENIGYGREDASLAEIAQAARIAQLEDFIQSLEDGYETIVGERGVTLSGGQRQRVSIARALLRDPPVLILDDATSSVDALTEELFLKAMESAMRGRTTFVIAHRLNTVHRADEIIVLKEGEISERGTHDELYALNGMYRQIYDLQIRPQHEVMLEFDVSIPVVEDESA